MTLRFASLGSGSRGNALLVESDDTLVMIDCGLARGDLEERFRRVGRSPADVTAILVSHEHGDHSRGVRAFLRRYRVPLWLTCGTASAIPRPPSLSLLSCHRPLKIGSIDVEPFPVPHDAREPCQFVFSAGGRRLAVLTDTGHVTPHVRERLAGCDALAIESNHDLAMLMASSYPDSVKARVASRYGHLSNAQAAALVDAIGHGGLQWIVGLHLSERCNSETSVRAALDDVLARLRSTVLHLATQDDASDWLVVD
jgi:phosphoribosyl 1,2-cyclic phosphodiesterase